MPQRLFVSFCSFVLLALGLLGMLVLAEWPQVSLNRAFNRSAFMMVCFSLLEGIVLIITGMVISSKRGDSPMGTIGTENPDDYPGEKLTKGQRGGSYIIAGALIFLVGGSLCFGGLFGL